MAGSVKRHFKDKGRYFGRPDRAVKANADRWERWGDKMSGKANADRIIAAQKEGQGPVIPMPDEEEIKRNRRRSNAARGGGRAATILSQGDGDRLGP